MMKPGETADARPRPFNRRAFAALTAGLSALALLVSGMGLHAHEGRGSHAWMATHGLLALLFIVSVVWHAVLNGRGLVRYVQASRGLSREALCAVGLVALVLVVALGHGLHSR